MLFALTGSSPGPAFRRAQRLRGRPGPDPGDLDGHGLVPSVARAQLPRLTSSKGEGRAVGGDRDRVIRPACHPTDADRKGHPLRHVGGRRPKAAVLVDVGVVDAEPAIRARTARVQCAVLTDKGRVALAGGDTRDPKVGKGADEPQGGLVGARCQAERPHVALAAAQDQAALGEKKRVVGARRKLGARWPARVPVDLGTDRLGLIRWH